MVKVKLSDIVKETIKVGGTIAKVGVELGADAIGAIAGKIDDNPEDKEKFVTSGKDLGKKIKNKTNEIADDSVGFVDNAVESSKQVFDDLSKKVKEKTSKSSQESNKNPSNKKEEDRSYITINTNTETKDK